MSPIRKIISKPIGELLIERGKLSKDQLDKALDVQKNEGGLIGEIIVKLNFVSEEDIAQALTAQYGFPFLPLENYDIDSEVLKSVPEELCKKYLLLPIDMIGNNITLAMANPLDAKAIEEVEKSCGCSIQTFVSTSSDVRAAIERYFKKG